jgi:hypothetical protein
VCFSPEADFVAAAALAPVGVATLHGLRRPEQAVIGALPLLFALHQLTEGFVWLGLQGDVSAAVRDAAIRSYLLFAQVVLPVAVPLGVLLVERNRWRRYWMTGLLALGAIVGAWFAWMLAGNPIGARAGDHAVVYDTDARFGYVVASAYVVATCGPALLAGDAYLRWFGVANLAGLAAAATVRYSAVTSIWCLYAAVTSVLILAYVRGAAGRRATPRATRSSTTGRASARGRR